MIQFQKSGKYEWWSLCRNFFVTRGGAGYYVITDRRTPKAPTESWPNRVCSSLEEAYRVAEDWAVPYRWAYFLVRAGYELTTVWDGVQIVKIETCSLFDYLLSIGTKFFQSRVGAEFEADKVLRLSFEDSNTKHCLHLLVRNVACPVAQWREIKD